MMAFGDAAAEKEPPEATRRLPRAAHILSTLRKSAPPQPSTAPRRSTEQRPSDELSPNGAKREAAEKKRIAEERARRRALRLELEGAVSEAERELTRVK